MPPPRIPPRSPCLSLLACAVAGIALSELVPASPALALAAALCFFIAALLGRRHLPFWLFVATVFLVRHQLDWRDAPGRFPERLSAQGANLIQATAIVTDDPQPRGFARHTPHSEFPIRVTSVTASGSTYRISFPALAYWSGPAPAWGDKIEVSAAIAPILPPRNPGEFDEPAYLVRKGIFRELVCRFPADDRVVASGKGNPLVAWGRARRADLQRRLTLGLAEAPEISELIQTVTLGLKQELPQEDRDLFQRTGTMHLFVVNGLHIALLALVLRFILKPMGLHRRRFALVIIPILFAYALLTGLSPGSVRAAIMAAVMFAASFAERKPFSWNTLAAAALILLAWDTNELFQPGFQFSFGVVSAILLLAGPLQRLLLPLGLPDAFLPRTLWTRWQESSAFCWREVAGLACVSTAACLGAMPFTAGYFHLVTPSAILANLLMVPVAAAILGEALLSLIASLFVTGAALLLNNTNWLLAWLMLWIVHVFAAFPGGYFFVRTSVSRPDCELTVLDLHPGQALLFQSHGAAWLVDCGNASAYHRTVRPFLQSRGVNRLDGLILTRGAAGPGGAALAAIADFSPRKILESSLPDHSPSRAALAQPGLPKSLLAPGDEFEIGPSVKAKVLFPPPGYTGRASAGRSLVIELQAGGRRLLLMSDNGFNTERWLLEHHLDLRADLLIQAGPPDDLSGTRDFLAAVHPAVLIRGAPSPFASSRPAPPPTGANLAIFRQEDTGAVTVALRAKQWSATAFMTAQTFVRQSE